MSYLVEDIFKTEMKATREGFGEGIVEVARRDEKVVVLCADLEESMRVVEFAKTFPGRFIEVGVAEQNMAGVAAGLALEGLTPFITSFAVFSPGRNWDQIRVSIAYTHTNVTIVGGHTGIAVGEDGATHQGLEDIALMRVLPHMTVVVPCDAEQTKKAVHALTQMKGPAYLRVARPRTAVFTSRAASFEIGKAQLLRAGKDVSVVGCGPILYQAMLAAEELKGEIDVEVINMHTIKPLDEEVLIRSAGKTGRVLTIEDHQTTGGLGGAVAEVLGEKLPIKMLRLGMKDVFGESGRADELLKKYGLDKEGIIKSIRKLV